MWQCGLCFLVSMSQGILVLLVSAGEEGLLIEPFASRVLVSLNRARTLLILGLNIPHLLYAAPDHV